MPNVGIWTGVSNGTMSFPKTENDSDGTVDIVPGATRG